MIKTSCCSLYTCKLHLKMHMFFFKMQVFGKEGFRSTVDFGQRTKKGKFRGQEICSVWREFQVGGVPVKRGFTVSRCFIVSIWVSMPEWLISSHLLLNVLGSKPSVCVQFFHSSLILPGLPPVPEILLGLAPAVSSSTNSSWREIQDQWRHIVVGFMKQQCNHYNQKSANLDTAALITI